MGQEAREDCGEGGKRPRGSGYSRFEQNPLFRQVIQVRRRRLRRKGTGKILSLGTPYW
jgi:hypothetical protein